MELIAAVEEVLEGLGNIMITEEKTREPVKAKAGVGYAFVEAPRGLLYHSYDIDEKGIIKGANIVAPTTFNHKPIERNLTLFAEKNATAFTSTQKRDDAMWGIEKIVRSYDPCLSCSVHMVEVNLTVDGENYSNRREQ